MSTIMKALDRLDREKDAEKRERPLREELAERHTVPQARARSRSGLLIGAGLGVALLTSGLLFVFSGGPAGAPRSREVSPAAAAAEVHASEPASEAETGVVPRASARAFPPPRTPGLRNPAPPAPEPVAILPEPRAAAREPRAPASATPAPVASMRSVPEASAPSRQEPAAAPAEDLTSVSPPGSESPVAALRDIRIARTIWHPTPERRYAFVEVSGQAGPLRVCEGDFVGRLAVEKIEPWGVVFLDDGIEVAHRVGGRK